ncbi:MAG: phosphoribosylanthranilate isomerase, partial [Lachnospiraceae bacterium]|nr:phosphoribosylanthranilate isomerase [Candidatus Equihabitans merdae]
MSYQDTKIKMCGLRREQDIMMANLLPIDYIGFVFATKSSRYLLDSEAADLKGLLAPSIQAVGVFVNEPVDHVVELLDQGIIDIAQLHGKEDAAYVAELRSKTDKPIWQAFALKEDEDIAKANASQADMILLDSSGGGSGNTFDWKKLDGITRPFMLAGGLNPKNVVEALEICHPYGV